MRRTSPSGTGMYRRVSASQTGTHRKVSASGTGAYQRVSASDTGSHRRVPNTAAQARVSSAPDDTGKYLAALDGTTSSLNTDRRRVRSQATRGYNVGKGHNPRHAAHVAPRPKRFPAWGVLLVIVLILGIGVGGFFLVRNIVHPYEGARVEDGQEVTVIIPEGSSGQDIIGILLEQGVIHSSSDFRKAVRDQNADQLLHSGTYSFTTGSDPAVVVKQLVEGPNSNEGQLVIPEGLTVTQTARVVEGALGISQDEFLKQAKASNYVADYPFLADAGNDSLEGFLYPKTYDFAGKEVTADSVIRLMLSQYETEAKELDWEGARSALFERYGLNVTDYDLLKLASIIEKEAISEDDRPKVSSVFYNRLASGMALQSDATMSYVTDGVVTSEDLTKDSPYNTYYYKGLPPTPICTPSGWAIEAAMHPADTEDYFFFIIEDGVYSNHTFSKTYEEHEAAYAVALKEQMEANTNASSAPQDKADDQAAASSEDESASAAATQGSEAKKEGE